MPCLPLPCVLWDCREEGGGADVCAFPLVASSAGATTAGLGPACLPCVLCAVLCALCVRYACAVSLPPAGLPRGDSHCMQTARCRNDEYYYSQALVRQAGALASGAKHHEQLIRVSPECLAMREQRKHREHREQREQAGRSRQTEQTGRFSSLAPSFPSGSVQADTHLGTASPNGGLG